MAKKKKTRKIFLMKPVPGYSYHAGEVHELPEELADTFIEMDKAREPEQTLPKDFPHREALIAGGLETINQIENAKDLKQVNGIGPAGEKEIIKYLKENS